MILSLTLRLIAVPELAWPRLTAACAQGERLPSPLGHAAAVGGVSVVSTMLGAMIASQRTVGSVVLTTLLAVVGYVGAAAAAVFAASSVVQSAPDTQPLRARFASAAVLPLCASGVLNIAPLPFLSLVLALMCAAISGWSAYVGASALLGLEGGPRRSAAGVIAAVGVSPILLTTLVRFVVSP